MTRRSLIVVLAAALLIACGAAAPQARAVSFVDKQVQAGALLIQKYVNDYGQANRYRYPPATMVKKSGGLPGSRAIWPSNPWTGRVMGPGRTKGTYTYKRLSRGAGYRLVVHLSSGNWTLKGGAPAWFHPERDTQCRQNLLLLQRYIEAARLAGSGTYPVAGDLTPATFAAPAYIWPVNPWTGRSMAQSAALGDFAYVPLPDGTGYSLKVMLTGGWSKPLGPLTPPGASLVPQG